LETGSRDQGHAHLGVILWSTRQRGPSSMSVPNLKTDIVIRSEVIRGPHNLVIGSRDPGHDHLGFVL